jgi:hypothetical protein
MKDFRSVSPLRFLEHSSRKGLGPGNLGVLIARAGVGKTACLIHIAFDKIFRGERLVHVSLNEGPEKITSYYNVIFYDLVKALDLKDEYQYRALMDRNRILLAYLNRSFQMDRLRTNLGNLRENVGFKPEAMIVDGVDFEKTERSLFEGFKSVAVEFGIEIWFSALSHRHITEANERGIPYPVHQVDDLFSLIVQLQPTANGLFLKILKDHDNPAVPENRLRLDPNTFLALD